MILVILRFVSHCALDIKEIIVRLTSQETILRINQNVN